MIPTKNRGFRKDFATNAFFSPICAVFPLFPCFSRRSGVKRGSCIPPQYNAGKNTAPSFLLIFWQDLPLQKSKFWFCFYIKSTNSRKLWISFRFVFTCPYTADTGLHRSRFAPKAPHGSRSLRSPVRSRPRSDRHPEWWLGDGRW